MRNLGQSCRWCWVLSSNFILSRASHALGYEAKFPQGAAVCRWLWHCNATTINNTVIENYARNVINLAGRHISLHFTIIYLKHAVDLRDHLRLLCVIEVTQLYTIITPRKIYTDHGLHAQVQNSKWIECLTVTCRLSQAAKWKAVMALGIMTRPDLLWVTSCYKRQTNDKWQLFLIVCTFSSCSSSSP